MTNNNEYENDEVKQWLARRSTPLAELRAKTLLEVLQCKEDCITDGVAIGISPTDSILNNMTRGEITNSIMSIFKKMRRRGSDGRIVPVAPLLLSLVGEYSPKHRWHYHGIIKVDNILVLDYVKRRLNKMIGRTITEQIRNYKDYVDYMFKQYECLEHGVYYCWNKKDCFINMAR